MSGLPQMSSGLSKLKKKHFRVKHQKVKLFRANEPLLSVFMWGVNHTVRQRAIPLSRRAAPRAQRRVLTFLAAVRGNRERHRRHRCFSIFIACPRILSFVADRYVTPPNGST